MKVLLINGSPHEKGCTYTALSLIAKELNASGIDTEILHVGGKPVGGCIGCGGCRKGEGCVFGGVVNEAALGNLQNDLLRGDIPVLKLFAQKYRQLWRAQIIY